ncbi:hypothetical protein K1719_032907 [Acacia pycnantha]|nr:hypothetical protein K1719_032907 [Acacia pycnantha]
MQGRLQSPGDQTNVFGNGKNPKNQAENSPTQHNWSVKVSLKLAGENHEESEINFIEMMKGTWMEIPVAQFIVPDLDDKGEEILMEFFLWDHGEKWKQGLIIKGVSIKPL